MQWTADFQSQRWHDEEMTEQYKISLIINFENYSAHKFSLTFLASI